MAWQIAREFNVAIAEALQRGIGRDPVHIDLLGCALHPNVGVDKTDADRSLIHSANVLLTSVVQILQGYDRNRTARVERRETAEHDIAALRHVYSLAVKFAEVDFGVLSK